MYKIVSRLLIYGDMPKDTILMELADIIRQLLYFTASLSGASCETCGTEE